MMPALGNSVAPVPPAAYHRTQAWLGPAFPSDALTLINTLHLLPLCRLAVRLAHHRCPPPFTWAYESGYHVTSLTESFFSRGIEDPNFMRSEFLLKRILYI